MRTAVVSNFDTRLRRILDETGLNPLFDAVIISAEASWPPPLLCVCFCPSRFYPTHRGFRWCWTGTSPLQRPVLRLERPPPPTDASRAVTGGVCPLPRACHGVVIRMGLAVWIWLPAPLAGRHYSSSGALEGGGEEGSDDH